MASELYLMEVGDGRYSILLCDDRSITRMPALTPAETLIAFSELDSRTTARRCGGCGTSILCLRSGSIFL